MYVDAACSPGFYGTDCTCTSDLAALLGGGGTTLTCSNGVWNATGPVFVNSLVDIQYDVLYVQDTAAGDVPAIRIFDSGNLTLHIRQYPDGTVDLGRIETPGALSANGTIHLKFDRLEQAEWTLQFAVYGALYGSPRLEVSSNATEFTCRSQTPPVEPIFLPNEARFNNTVTNTATKCGFNKGSRNWALYTYIAIASFAGAVIIFTIFTCAITPWRKVIWYPPM